MKKSCKRIVSVMMSLIMMISALPIVGLDIGIKAEAKTISDYSTGDIIEFGSYPQSRVTDTSLISSLNSLSKTWVSYGYYTGTGDWEDGQMKPGDWMKYADVSYGGNKYRAVTFSQYRPYGTGERSSAGNSYQDDNGYYTNTVYWFKYEPLKWRVLDAEDGLVMCESIIDSQAYNNTIYYSSAIASSKGSGYAYFQDSSCTTYANDYAASSIRDWLNEDFYNTAFTSSEKTEIGTTTLDNSCWSSSYPQYDSATTNDKIFLLSYDEVRNTAYGFSSETGYDKNREARGTDYAKCQGHTGSSYTGNSYWRLRSPGSISGSACIVEYDGDVSYDHDVSDTHVGIRPALKFNSNTSVEEKTEAFPNGYDFLMDRWTFCNQTTEITKEQYQEAFGIIKGATFYKEDDKAAEDKKPGQNGQCYGMAASTGVFIGGYLPVSSIIPLPTSKPGRQANYLIEADNGTIREDSYITPFEMDLSYFISYGQLVQSASSISKQKKNNKDNLQSIYNAVQSYVYGLGDPVVISVCGEYVFKKARHEVLAIGIESEDKDKAVIAINDSNKPVDKRHLILNKDTNTGEFVSWEFELDDDVVWETGGKYTEISYSMPCELLYNVGIIRQVMVAVSGETGNSVIDNDEKLLVLDSENESVLSEVNKENLYPISNITGETSNSTVSYWLDDSMVDEVELIADSEPVSVQMCDDFSSVGVTLPEDSKIKLVVDDEKDNFAKISTEKAEDIDMLFSTVGKNNEIITLTVFGTADSEEITATETEEGIVLTGVESGTVTLTVDEEVVKTETFDNARGQVEVKYDKTDAETDVEIDYISYLRLLNATASSENGEIIITANDDAEKAGIYPTTESGEAVSLITESTPIKISSSGTYYINFADWHKAGNQTQTTMTIGEKQYPVKFVFPIENDGHEYTSVVVPPTKAEQGYTKYTCSCGDTYNDNFVDALGFEVKGSIISFGDNSSEITFELIKFNEEEPAYTSTVSGNSSEFIFEGVEAGSYILRASKENHVTREYEIEIAEDIELNIQLNLVGDLNGDGKINTVDVARANATAKGVSTLVGYDFACADINGDGKVNTMDVARMNAHAKGVSTLW